MADLREDIRYLIATNEAALAAIESGTTRHRENDRDVTAEFAEATRQRIAQLTVALALVEPANPAPVTGVLRPAIRGVNGIIPARFEPDTPDDAA